MKSRLGRLLDSSIHPGVYLRYQVWPTSLNSTDCLSCSEHVVLHVSIDSQLMMSYHHDLGLGVSEVILTSKHNVSSKEKVCRGAAILTPNAVLPAEVKYHWCTVQKSFFPRLEKSKKESLGQDIQRLLIQRFTWIGVFSTNSDYNPPFTFCSCIATFCFQFLLFPVAYLRLIIRNRSTQIISMLAVHTGYSFKLAVHTGYSFKLWL